MALEASARLTPEGERVLALAQEEARRFRHRYLGTDHLLLGLVRDERGRAARVLRDLGVAGQQVRSAVEYIIGRGERGPLGEPALSPRAFRVIDLAMLEARRLGEELAGPEHLLLGLLREGEGMAAGVLESLGVDLPRARRQVFVALGPADFEDEETPGRA